MTKNKTFPKDLKQRDSKCVKSGFSLKYPNVLFSLGNTAVLHRFPHLADLRHLRLVDVSVLVHVKEREGPLQFPGGLPRGGHVQCNDVLLEVQSSVIVGVERAKHVPRVALGVAFGEKAGVDLLELFGTDAPCWALLLEVLVPLADFGFGEFGAELQVVQDLLR